MGFLQDLQRESRKASKSPARSSGRGLLVGLGLIFLGLIISLAGAIIGGNAGTATLILGIVVSTLGAVRCAV